jgi:hypothetical protein
MTPLIGVVRSQKVCWYHSYYKAGLRILGLEHGSGIAWAYGYPSSSAGSANSSITLL